MDKPFIFITNCIAARGCDIRDMLDHPKQRDITRETFLKHVDYEHLSEIERDLGYSISNDGGLRMARDWHVTYSRSYYKGKPCYYFTWSSIEYIFIQEED